MTKNQRLLSEINKLAVQLKPDNEGHDSFTNDIYLAVKKMQPKYGLITYGLRNCDFYVGSMVRFIDTSNITDQWKGPLLIVRICDMEVHLLNESGDGTTVELEDVCNLKAITSCWEAARVYEL